MRLSEISKLSCGDEVCWIDPDEGRCSKTLIIHKIWIEKNIVCIEAQDGSYLECYARELE